MARREIRYHRYRSSTSSQLRAHTKEMERIDDLLDDTRRQGQTLQNQINAQASARAALASNLRNEANARFTKFDKSLRSVQSDWTKFEDRQTRIVERKTEADAARDAKWKGVKEAAAWNPLTAHLNTEGKLDLKGYQAAKDAGMDSRNISDYTKVGAYTDGITMGDEALKQYNIDTAQADPTWTDIKQKPLTDLNEQTNEPVSIGSIPSLTDINKRINETAAIGSVPPLTDIIEKIDKPVASTGAGHTYSSVASKGGYSGGGGAGLKISPGKTDINALKRKSWKPPGKVSNSSSVNV